MKDKKKKYVATVVFTISATSKKKLEAAISLYKKLASNKAVILAGN